MTPAEAERAILAIADDVECDFADVSDRKGLPAYLRRQARRLREAVRVLMEERAAVSRRDPV